MISGSGASASGGLESAAAPRNNRCLSTTLNIAMREVDIGEVGKYEWVASEELG